MSFKDSVFLATGSTDGHVAFWALRTAGQPFSTPSTSETGPVLAGRHHIHQSSIKALLLARLSTSEFLLVTGGDDNALALTRVCHQGQTEQADSTHKELSPPAITCSTLLIPRAHASSINAVTELTQVSEENFAGGSCRRLAFATTGNDQRVKTWTVEIDVQLPGTEAIQVKRTASWYSEVADATCMDIYKELKLGREPEEAIMVAGIGVETWDVRSRGPTKA